MIENNNTELVVNGSAITVEITGGRSVAKVACLGPAGTNTEEAREYFLPDGDKIKYYKAFLKSNSDVVRAVEAGEFDLGVVPVENAIYGDVLDVIRGLIHTEPITILAEHILPIRHMLISRGDPSTIQAVISHPQALGQCSRYLANHLPQAKLETANSTSEAVEQILDRPTAAAIATQRAATLYGMPIIVRDIGDIAGNTTRFYLIGRGITVPTGYDLTSMVINPNANRVGLLRDVLHILAQRNINLTNIRSHPTGDPKMRKYLFLATCTGHHQDENVALALEDMKQQMEIDIKILGSYKEADIPEGVKAPGSLNGDQAS